MVFEKHSRSPFPRLISFVALTFAVAVSLSGCFIIPVLDGRSPFDDPFGVTRAKRDAGVEKLQEVLDEIDFGDDWVIEAWRGDENCEGICKLHLVAAIVPSGKMQQQALEDYLLKNLEPEPRTTFMDVEIPSDVWLKVVKVSLQVAEQENLDLAIESSINYGNYLTHDGSEYIADPNYCAAMFANLDIPQDMLGYSDEEGRFRTWVSDPVTRCEIMFKSRNVKGIAESLGLNE